MSDTKKNLIFVFVIIALLFIIHFINYITPFEMRSICGRARTVPGLWGMLFTPFFHANMSHLYHNSVWLAILLLIAFFTFGRKDTLWSIVMIIIFTGAAKWVFDINSIGASGVVFGLKGLLMIGGWRNRKYLVSIFGGFTSVMSIPFEVLALISSVTPPVILRFLFIQPTSTNICHACHILGFIFGCLAGYFIYDKTVKKDEPSSAEPEIS
ncbi:MAG: rhomboid family intramembrane serine protease [Acidobacteria bacterium]|nr:rhomboid family intramembrane serine protease [Acidobacteriota bacterium]